MAIGFYTKWIIGGILSLIIVAGACYLWYQHDTAPYKQEAAETTEVAREWEAAQKAEAKNKVEQATDVTSVESNTLTTEKSITKTNAEVAKDTAPTQAQNDAPAETAETADVQVSPFGFGPYPEVPADYFRQPSWLKYPNGVPGDAAGPFEIMDRVLIKLWNQGHKNITGASYSPGGKVYPHYANTAYVSYGEKIILPDGTVHQRIRVVKGGPDIAPFVKQIEKGNTPAHVKLLDYDSAGIDPHIFLKKEDQNDP